MAVPDYPVDRREAYLNNIATGSGSIPEYPVTREEAYLDAIAQGGGGGGSSSGVLVVTLDLNTGALDKTWQEIKTALDAKTLVTVWLPPDEEGDAPSFFAVVLSANQFGQDFVVRIWSIAAVQHFDLETNSADGYPVMSEGNA